MKEKTLGSGWPVSSWKNIWGWQEVELKHTDGNRRRAVSGSG